MIRAFHYITRFFYPPDRNLLNERTVRSEDIHSLARYVPQGSFFNRLFKASINQTSLITTGVLFNTQTIQAITIRILFSQQKILVRQIISKCRHLNSSYIEELTEKYCQQFFQAEASQDTLKFSVHSFLDYEMEKEVFLLTQRNKSAPLEVPYYDLENTPIVTQAESESLYDQVKSLCNQFELTELCHRLSSSFKFFTYEKIKPIITDLYLEALFTIKYKEAFSQNNEQRLKHSLEKFLQENSHIAEMGLEEIREEIDQFFRKETEYERLQEYLVDIELKGKDYRDAKFSGELLTAEDIASYARRFHEEYQIFFTWLKEHAHLKVSEISKSDHLLKLSFYPALISNLIPIYVNAAIARRYQELYPNSFNLNGLHFLFQKKVTTLENFNEENIHQEIDKFLKSYEQLEYDLILDQIQKSVMLGKNYQHLKFFDLYFQSAQYFRSEAEIFYEEYGIIYNYIEKHEFSLSFDNIYTALKDRLKVISYRRFIKTFIFIKINIHINNFYPELKAEIRFFIQSFKQFFNPTNQSLEDALKEFLIQVDFQQVNRIVNNSNLDNYLLNLATLRNKLRNSFNDSLLQVNHQINRAIFCNFAIDVPNKSDLKQRANEVQTIQWTIERFLTPYLRGQKTKEEAAVRTPLIDEIEKLSFKVLTPKEVSYLCYQIYLNTAVKGYIASRMKPIQDELFIQAYEAQKKPGYRAVLSVERLLDERDQLMRKTPNSNRIKIINTSIHNLSPTVQQFFETSITIEKIVDNLKEASEQFLKQIDVNLILTQLKQALPIDLPGIRDDKTIKKDVEKVCMFIIFSRDYYTKQPLQFLEKSEKNHGSDIIEERYSKVFLEKITSNSEFLQAYINDKEQSHKIFPKDLLRYLIDEGVVEFENGFIVPILPLSSKKI